MLLVRQVDGGDPIHVIRNDDGKGRWPAWTPGDQESDIWVAERTKP